MPFTPSHVAAVLPFAATPLLPAALVIGSMGPDLFYYVPLPVSRSFTHSWLGVVTVDLALGVLLFALWQLVFRTPLVDFAPLNARRRIAALPWSGIRPAGMSWARLLVLLVASVLVGTVTHVAWDSFTHYGWVTQHLPWLLEHWGAPPIYEWGQYFSSLFGAVAVVVWVTRWWRRTDPVDPAPTRVTTRIRLIAWATALGAGLLAALVVWIPVGILRGISPINGTLVFHTVTTGIAATALVAVGWSLAWWARRGTGQDSGRPGPARRTA